MHMYDKPRVCLRTGYKNTENAYNIHYNIIKHIRKPDPHPLGDRKFGGAVAELYYYVYVL